MSPTGEGDRAREEADEAAWRDIVDNFGERAHLEESEIEPVAEPVTPAPEQAPVLFEVRPSAYDDAQRFVPPPPPPVPRPEPKRAIAWAGLFGAPVLVLLLLVAQIDLPTVLDYLLVGWFVGGFGYLIATMSKLPRDPWDDGSRV